MQPLAKNFRMSPKGKVDNKNEELVTCVSRTLTDVEQRYSQFEKESLAIVWACERLKMYLIGREFDLYTDNSAAQTIFNNPFSNPSARVRRWTLRMLPFKCRIFHIDGNGNIADYLSRNPVKSTCCEHERIAEEYIYMVTTASIPSALSKQEIIDATILDPVLTEAIQAIQNNTNLKHSELNQWLKQMTVTEDGILLRDTRVVIPKALTQRIVNIGHTGHQGMVKTKALIRHHVWFPKLDAAVENTVRNCVKCQANTNKTVMEPVKILPIPLGPWEEVDTDFFGPLPNGKYQMVFICRYSKFLVIRSINNLKALTVISVLDKGCAEFGFMHKLKSDNGPPFKSYEFNNFCTQSGIIHIRITPYWPRANGLVERVMQPLAKSIRVVGKPSLNYETEICEYTRAYNLTPHSSTLIPPRDLFFKTRTSSVRLPTFHLPHKNINDSLHTQAIANDCQAKETSKVNTDFNMKTNNHTFSLGQEVLLKQTQTNKTMTPFDPVPFKITNIKGSMVEINRNGRTYARNVALIQPFNRIKPLTTTIIPLATKPQEKSSIVQTPRVTRFAVNPNAHAENSPSEIVTNQFASIIREPLDKNLVKCQKCNKNFKKGAGIAAHKRYCK